MNGMSVHFELCHPWSGNSALQRSSSMNFNGYYLASCISLLQTDLFSQILPQLRPGFWESAAPSNSCCMEYGWVKTTEEKLMLLLQDSLAAPDFIWTPGPTYTYSKIKNMSYEEGSIKLVYQINPIKIPLVLGMVHYIGIF